VPDLALETNEEGHLLASLEKGGFLIAGPAIYPAHAAHGEKREKELSDEDYEGVPHPLA